MQMPRDACKRCGKALAATPAPARPSSKPSPRPLESSPNPYAPPEASAEARPAAAADDAFDRDRFLMRQKMLTINEAYQISNEAGQPILHVQRPSHILRNLGAVFAGLVAAFVLFMAPIAVSDSAAAAVIAFLLAGAGFIATSMILSAKRHVSFYRDEAKSTKVLEILQDQKLAIPRMTFTVNDAAGRNIGRLSKNIFTDVLRKRWDCYGPGGQLLFYAMEDSWLRAIFRRFVSRLLPLHFVFCPAGSVEVLGQFNRQLTLFDRYVLDLSPDPRRHLDRRLALALGVMLDTGERR